MEGRKYKVYLLSLLFTLVSWNSVYAQLNSLKKGDKIKVWALALYNKSIVGQFTDRNDDIITVVSNNEFTLIPLAAVNKIQISTGKKRCHFRGAGIGALIGTVSFGLVSLASNLGEEKCTLGEGCSGHTKFGTEMGYIMMPVVGAVFGTVIGFVVGSLYKTDKWETISLEGIDIQSSYINPDKRYPVLEFRLALHH
jgi:hypothetical protein